MPDLDRLTRRLNAVLASPATGITPVEIVHRRRPRLASTFPIEIVTCRLAHGARRRLLIKYQSSRSHPAHGHRGGLPYEAEVYRRLLASRAGSRPRLYGASIDGETGDNWLALEYLDRGKQIQGTRMVEGAQEGAMVLAARWIARFHTEFEEPSTRESFGFLKRYDEEYYAGWVRRTGAFASTIEATRPWLPSLCERQAEILAPLLMGFQTVVHGEFYTNNIILCRRSVHAVDWESTAVASCAIDLAALTDGPWHPQIVRSCEQEYVRTRWPAEAPPGFERALEAARLYLQFRWLGDKADRTTSERSLWRIERLRSAAGRLGLLEGESDQSSRTTRPTDALPPTSSRTR